MSQINYELYLQKIFTLAKTLVIKDTATAGAINDDLLLNGYTVLSDQPKTWKYYLNLAGLYHSSDTAMQVTSLDTLETIDFNPTTLTAHIATRRAYHYGSTYYNLLLAKYPNQESLIMGCLNPVDIDAAINAEDHTILYYDPALVETQELNLIPLLQQWINAYFIRWVVSDYALTDNLYNAAVIGQLFQQIIPAIINLRLQNCHTRFAHSYHIKEYLASHGSLDVYYDTLTIKQALWLYRNINYIRKHAGKADTFDWLVEHIMTERGLPLAAYKMKHNLADMPDGLTPTIELERTQLNLNYSGTIRSVHSVPHVLEMEFPKARDNELDYNDDVSDTTASMRHSLSDILPTKILESQVIDKTDAEPYSKASMLLNHWIYYVSRGIYTATCIVENPSTGAEMVLSAKEALMIWVYVISKLAGFTPTAMDAIQVVSVRKIIPPSKAAIRAKMPSKRVSDLLLTGLCDGLTETPSKIISTETFWNHIGNLHDDLTRQRVLVGTREHYITRGLAESVVGMYYQDCRCAVNVGVNFSEFFAEQGFDIEGLAVTEYEELAKSIIGAVTGADQHGTITMKELQAAMLAIMVQLSSYSVQFIQTINDSGFKYVGLPAIRLGDIAGKGVAEFQDNLPTSRGLSHSSHGSSYFNPDDVDGHDLEFYFNGKGKASTKVTFDIGFKQTGLSSMFYRIPLHPRPKLSLKINDSGNVSVTKITDMEVTLLETDSTLTVSGKMAIAKKTSDVEFVPFTALLGSEKYGFFSIDANGVWIYYTTAPHNEFVADETYSEFILVQSTDGAVGRITVNIRGTDDATYFESKAIIIKETNNKLYAVGNLSIVDPDSTVTFVPFDSTVGQAGIGYFTLTSGGSWTFNAKEIYNELASGSSLTDRVIVETTNGVLGSISVTIDGTDDLMVIDDCEVNIERTGDVLNVNGQITATDIDSPVAYVPLTDITGDAGFGKFNISSSGSWSWVSTNLTGINSNGYFVDSTTVHGMDGSVGQVRVRIHNTVALMPTIEMTFNESEGDVPDYEIF